MQGSRLKERETVSISQQVIQTEIQNIDSQIQEAKSNKTSGASGKQGTPTPKPSTDDKNQTNIDVKKSIKNSGSVIDTYA